MKVQSTVNESTIRYSVILPVFNECENIEPLIHEIAQNLSQIESRFEIICVDDKSTDGSLERLREIRATRPYVNIVQHARNFGQSAALATGMANACGKIIITLDSDGQNDPSDLPDLIAALKPGIDAVCGIRQKRQDSFVRRLSSRMANGFRDWVTGDHVLDSGCNFRVIRREVLEDIPVFNGMHRFIPSLLRFKGCTVLEIPIGHRPRRWGTSKYGIQNRLWRGLADCLAMRWWRKRVIPSNRVMNE